MWRKAFLRSICLFLLLPGCAFGQALVTGKIAGTVTDSSDATVTGAKVVASGSALMAPQTTTTKSDGSYLLNLLPPGVYTVTITATGFETYVQQNVEITAGFTATVNAKMHVGAVTEQVTVNAAPPVDVATATTSTTYGTALLQNIPTGNDPWSTVALTAGETQDQMDVAGSKSFYQSTTEVHGSLPGQQSYSFNGLAMNWPEGSNSYTTFYINRDDLQEFHVESDGAQANVSVGGVYMNMVTRSGTNQWHGDAAAYYLTSQFQSTPSYPVFGGTVTRVGTPFQMSRDTTVDGGGPIISNKLWIFGSYGRYDTVENNVAIPNLDGTTTHSSNHQSNTLARLDYQINAKNRVNFNWWWNEQNQFNRFDATFPTANATWQQIEPAYILQGQWTSLLTSNLSLDTRLGWNHLLFPLMYEPGVGPNAIPISDIQTGTLTGAAIFQQINNTDVIALASTASYSKSNWGGTHLFQFGYEFTDGRNRYLYLANHNLEEFLNNGAPFEVTVYNTPSDAREVYHNNSFFALDSWTIKRRLTLSLGLRYEHYNTFNPAQTRVAATDFPTLFPAQSFPASGNITTWNTVSPRIGVAFDPTGKGDQVFRASFGIYELQQGTGPAEAVNQNAFSGKTYAWGGAVDSNGLPTGFLSGPLLNAFGGVTTMIDPKLKRPYSEEISAGYERTIFKDIRIGVNYYFRVTKNQMGTPNLSTPLSDWTPITALNGVTLMNPITKQPLTVYQLKSGDIGLFNSVLTTIPAFDDNRYDGVDFTAEKRLSHNWQVLTGFTVSRNTGLLNSGSGDNFNDPNLNIGAANSYLNFDATYVFKAATTYVIPKIGVSFSANYQHYSGYPFQPVAVIPGSFTTGSGSTQTTTTVLNEGSETVALLPAGSMRLPDRDSLNLRFSRPFTLRDRFKFEPIVDLFNITNSASIINELNSYGTYNYVASAGNPVGFSAASSYLQPTDMLNPRVLRLGLKISF